MGWYRDFFDEWYLRYWIQPLTVEQTGREVDAIIRFLDLAPGARVLDLCCGQGRHSLELARRGYDVVGYDLSHTLLDHAREESKKENLTIEFVQGDMRELPFDCEFDGAFNFYTAFGYFEHDEENQQVLTAAAAALKPRARFLLDYPCLEGRMPDWKTQVVRKYDDGTIMIQHIHHNVFDQTIVNDVLYITPDNRRHETGFTLRHFYGRELQVFFTNAGMPVIAHYGNIDGDPLTNCDTRVLVVGRKNR